MVSLDFVELTNEQRRQMIDAQQVYTAWRPAAFELDSMGSLTVRTSKDKQYMAEAHGKVRKSLGKATPALLKRKADHDARRKSLAARVKGTSGRLEQMAPVNRALRIGSMRRIVARIIRELDREGLLGDHVIVAETNALHAYEAACGVQISQEHVATTDADLVWDGDHNLFLAARGVKRDGLMGILRRVDKSFAADYGYNATNSDGFIVDLICPEDTDPTTMNADGDLEAAPMEGIKWLLGAPRFEHAIVAEDGFPLRIVVPDPRTFALHKLWVSRQSSRSAPKKKRDHAHAVIVAELATTYLSQKLVAKEMSWLPPELKKLVGELGAMARQQMRNRTKSIAQ